MRHRIRLLSVLGLLAAASASARAADPGEESASRQSEGPGVESVDEEKARFLRLLRDEDDELLAMQTAIVRYRDPNSDMYVDLVGVVHIGEREYYDELNEILAEYDSVLYELVAPEGTRVPRGGQSSGHPVAFMQQALKSLLELESQLACIDYQAEHFVHADLSPEEFADSMAQRGESFWTLLFRMMRQSVIQQSQGRNRGSELDFITALFDPNRSMMLKRVMAEQFEDLEGSMAALSGPDGSAIITDRNSAALEVLDEQLAAGKKRLAVFYGAGHMPDLHERLIADYGLEQDRTQWLVAWKLSDAPIDDGSLDESDVDDAEVEPVRQQRRRSIIRFDRPETRQPADVEDLPVQ